MIQVKKLKNRRYSLYLFGFIRITRKSWETSHKANWYLETKKTH